MDRFHIKNFRMHKMLAELSRILLFCLESDSNNSSAQVVARDSRNVQSALSSIEKELGYLETYRDAPMGTIEHSYSILLPKLSEIQRMNNRPMQCVAQELMNFGKVLIFNDSSQQQQWIGEGPNSDVRDSLSTVKTIVAETIGTGQPSEDHATGYEVGPKHADYSRLGMLKPDVDMDSVSKAEPRVGSVIPPKVPDSPDVPSDLPGSVG
jgi:hypothetical protein